MNSAPLHPEGWNPFDEWIESLQSFEIKPLSNDTCCRLLAVLYVFGGEREVFTHNKRLVANIKYAQTILSLHGGEPSSDPELVEILRRYVKELMPNGWFGKYIKTEWAKELMENYDVKL